jgi:hypothetical protein
VSVPVESTAGPALKSAAFVLFVTSNVSVWPASSAGPALIAVAQVATVWVPESSATDSFAPAVKLGASFTPVTVIEKVCAAETSTPPSAVPPLSCSVSVIVAVPTALTAGV